MCILRIFCENASYIIGVLGTIVGTITGALLSYFLNKRGKIDVIVRDDDYKDQKNNSNEYMYYLHVFISNNSSIPNYIRNIKVRFCGKNNEIVLESLPKIAEFKTLEGLSEFGDSVDNSIVSTFSFYGHEVKDIVLCDIIDEHFDKLESATKIKMSYEYKNKNKSKVTETTIIPNFSLERVDASTNATKFSRPIIS